MRRLACAGLLSLLWAGTVGAVITSDGPGTHVVQPGQAMFRLDLDGVALIAGDLPNAEALGDLLPLCSGALISDFHVLSAAHCYDADRDGRLDFPFNTFPHVAVFELADRIERLRIDARQTAIPAEFGSLPADIAVLTLEEAAPVDIPRYPLHVGTNVIGRPIVITGYGGTGDGEQGALDDFDAASTKRAGLNRYEILRDGEPFPGLELLTYDFDSGLAKDNVLQVELDVPSDLGFGDDEVLAAHGDSGGPVFVDGVIAAVSTYGGRLDDRPDEAWGAFGFDVPVVGFREFIESATGGAVRFILPGDFDADEQLTASDIDQLTLAFRNGDTGFRFDVNRDHAVDSLDRTVWVKELARTWFGDANLDGQFNTSDFVSVFLAGEYEDAVALNSGWSEGDWDGDGDFNSGDFVAAFLDGGYEQGPLSVPEPSGLLLALVGLLMVALVRAETQRR